MDLSLVVPCYNEAANLPLLFEAMAASLPRDYAIEVIFVDNGSTDDSARVFAELLPRYPFARGVRIPVNQGYGHGILTGLHAATGDVVGWTHADMQTHPRDAMDAYRAHRAALLAGRCVVKGRRIGRPLVDRLFTIGMNIVSSTALHGRFSDVNAQPKLFSRALLDAMASAPADFSLDLYLLWLAGRKGYRVVEHPVEFPRRRHGEAKGGGSLRTKWRLTRRTLSFIAALRREIAAGRH